MKIERSEKDIERLHDLYGALNKARDNEHDAYTEQIDALSKHTKALCERLTIERELSDLKINLSL